MCQAFSGPGSTKMHYCINLMHDGFVPAVLGWLIWTLPGAIGMWALAVGVSNIDDTLPAVVYALLSGLNSATVGIIALAAVQLSQKAITDGLTRVLVFLGATAGMLYNDLWYFPVLMLLAGITSFVFDKHWLQPPVLAVVAALKNLHLRCARKKAADEASAAELGRSTTTNATTTTTTTTTTTPAGVAASDTKDEEKNNAPPVKENREAPALTMRHHHPRRSSSPAPLQRASSRRSSQSTCRGSLAWPSSSRFLSPSS